jgi:cobalamin biosynthesis protein CobD/CbiB
LIADGTIRTSDATRGRTSGNLRHQDGFVRGAIVLFVIVSVVGMFILDVLSVYTAHKTLVEQTASAATEAATSYVQVGSEQIADQAAANYLADRGSTLVKIVGNHTNGLDVYTVTAKRVAKTYFFHYLTGLPKIGHWIDKELHPVVTGDNTQ